MVRRAALFCVFLVAIATVAFAQQTSSRVPRVSQPSQPQDSENQGESSSKETKIDLSPPLGEPDFRDRSAGAGTDDVKEMRPWNPLKADKNVEVGDYYFKRKNYSAAESRYREALYWQDNHALASVHLAATLEKLGQFQEARKYYEQYLKILPGGPNSKEARDALARLQDKPDRPLKERAEQKKSTH